MIEYIKDIALCIIIAIILLFLGTVLNSSFFEIIISSLLEVVFAVFAINIASAAIIAQLLAKVTALTNHPMTQSRKDVSNDLRLQAFMLVSSIILLITYKADLQCDSILYAYKDQIKYCSEVLLITIYLYFIWLTYELGKTLFEILKYIS